MASRYNLSVYKNRAFEEHFKLIDELKTPIDITGATITSEVRALDGTLMFLCADSIIDAANGVFSISGTDVNTNTLTADVYFNQPLTKASYIYDVVVVFAGGEQVTVIEGEVNVYKGVTG